MHKLGVKPTGDNVLDVRLLGQFDVQRDGVRLTLPTRNAQSLLAFLILNAGKAHRRERLAGLLWPDSIEENARSNLRHELWRLRKALGSEGRDYLLADDITLAFNSESDYSLDVQRLENAAQGDSTTNTLIAALSAYQGELLPGFYDEWVVLERNRLYALFEAQVTRLLETLQAEGRWIEVLDWANRWISLGQWPEAAYRFQMLAHANLGDIPNAALTFERYARALQKELGMKPSEQTQDLYKRLKAGWKSNLQTQVLAPAKPRSTSQLAGVVPASSPAGLRRTNLPRPLTSFIGREVEIQQVTRLISSARLVTITGSGGVGKTRLAIQVAEQAIPNSRDGVWWVELASLTSPDQIDQAIAKVLRIPDTAGPTPFEAIVERLEDQQALLVLDNCEHLIDGCATLIERLLSACLQISILATSREVVGLPGEKAWPLSSLSLPVPGDRKDPDRFLQSEAVRLFIERAGDIFPDFQPGEADLATIAQICQNLDGIPLAIELAAARINVLSVQEIAARLDRRFSLLTGGRRIALPRHQTLLAAIEWSYDLLTEPERSLFHQLSVFPGSFTLEAAEAICSGERFQSDEVLPLVSRLVDKSLLNLEPNYLDTDLATRYSMLETIRTYGRLKLDDMGETIAVRSRHADYYVRLVEAAEPELLKQNQRLWSKLLAVENDNLRAVIEWNSENEQVKYALRLVGALTWFWYYSGSPREGCYLAHKALSSIFATQFKEERARALNTAGFLQCMLGETISARQSLEEAMSILRMSGDETNLAWTMQYLGLVYSFLGEYGLADAAIKEGLTISKKLWDRNINNYSFFLGDLELQMGNRSSAIKMYEESANFQRMYGNKSFLAYPLRRLGYLAFEQNDIATAWTYFRESLLLNLEVSDKPGMVACLTSMVRLALCLENPMTAIRLYGIIERRLELFPIKLLYLDQIELEHIRGQINDLVDESSFKKAFDQGWEMNDEAAMEMVTEIISQDVNTKLNIE